MGYSDATAMRAHDRLISVYTVRIRFIQHRVSDLSQQEATLTNDNASPNDASPNDASPDDASPDAE